MDFLIYITKHVSEGIFPGFSQKTTDSDRIRSSYVDILSTLSTLSTICLVDKCTYFLLKKDVIK